MQAWFNLKLDICKHFRQAPMDNQLFEFMKFVLAHQGIYPRNVILDAPGHVRFIDWADAGAYLPAFKPAALAAQLRFSDKMVLDPIPRYPAEVKELGSMHIG